MKQNDNDLTYLELYSGIGGWGLALNEASRQVSSKQTHNNLFTRLRLNRINALDRSEIAKEVSRFNFSSSSTRSKQIGLIENLTISQLENSYCANIWVMSPPCQPFTRNNDVAGDETDERSASFLHLCRLLGNNEKYLKIPQLILMENVIGFEAVR